MKSSVRIRTLVVFVSGFLLAIIAGFRGGNDPDYLNYYDIYLSSQHGDFFILNVEPFYFYINKLFNLAGVPFVFLMLLIAVPAVLVKMYVIYKHSHFAVLSIIIYVLTIYISFELIAIRQGIAIALIMLATSFWFDKRFLAIALVLIGSLFHISALIILPAFYLMSSRWNRRIIIVSFFAIIFAVFFGAKIDIVYFIKLIPLIPEFVIYKLDVYSSYNQSSANSVKQIFICVVAFAIYLTGSENNFIRSVCFLYIIGFLFSIIFSAVGDIAFRIKWYFFWGEVFFVPYILFTSLRMSKNKKLNPLKIMLFGLLVLVLYLYPAINFINDISNRGNSLIL